MGFLDQFKMKKPDATFSAFGLDDLPPELREGMTSGGTLAPRISRAMALQVPAVLRSRNLIAGTLARLPIHVRDSQRNIAEPTTLFAQVDRDLPNVVTYAETYEDLLFEGISWWRVEERGFHGYPTYACHIDVRRVSVRGWNPPVNGSSPSQAYGPLGVFIDGYPVRDDEVIRFDSPNPPLLVHGARAIRTCLNLDMTAAGYSGDPVPLGILSPRDGVTRPKEDQEYIEELLDRWEEARRRRVWAYLPSTLEAQSFQFNAEQIQLAEQRQHAVLEIARAAGIDPEDLGVSTTSRTYQNSEQRRQDLIDMTFAPYIAAVEQRLSMRDVLPRGYEAKVNLDGFLRADTKGRMDAYAVGFPLGAYTLKEIRELEDKPDIPRSMLPKPEPAPNTIPSPEEATSGT
jgi:hypothetical protein